MIPRPALALALVAGLAAFTPLAGAEIASDGFERGALAGPLWGSATSVTVSTDRAHAGSRSAKFHFGGNASLDADAWSELRFDLGAVYPELWLRYRLHIPANFVHRDANSSDNNKFIRLWGSTYSDLEKVGASTWLNAPADGYSALIVDWNSNGDGIGPKGTVCGQFIAAADRGTWMDVMIHAKAATATARGTFQVWKNGSLAIDGAGTVDNFTAGEAHGYRYGYLLGWANSGFAQDTDFAIDDVVFGTTQADVAPPPGNHAPVAQAQSASTAEDTAVAIRLGATDADGDTLSYVIASGPNHGSLTGSGANRVYMPAAGYHGGDGFTFRANDGTTDSSAATVALTVTPVNDAPVAYPEAVEVISGAVQVITLEADDDDGDALTYAITDGPVHGSLSGSGAVRTYTPSIGYVGSDSFTFTAGDGSLTSAPVVVAITVMPVSATETAEHDSDDEGKCGSGGVFGLICCSGLMLLRRAGKRRPGI